MNTNSKSIADNYHGRVIKYSGIAKLPKRMDYLDTKDVEQVDSKISSGSDLLFMPNGVYESTWQDAEYKKATYKIYITGVLIDGRKAIVVLNNIIPYFNVKLEYPSGDIDPVEFYENEKNRINTELGLNGYETCGAEIIYGKPSDEWQPHNSAYLKLSFCKTKVRKSAINYIRSKGYITAHDDPGSYYRVVCRDYDTSYSAWTTISNYECKRSKYLTSSAFYVDVNNYKVYTGDQSDARLRNDKIMTKTWDIETYSAEALGVPKPENKTDNIFMIGMTFQWHWSDKPLLKVVLVDKPCAPHQDLLTIVCESEVYLIKAFGKIHSIMDPDISMGFNDQTYDWDWIVKRGYKYRGLLTYLAESMDCSIPFEKMTDDRVMSSFIYKTEKIKIDASTDIKGTAIWVPGCINVDVMILFRQMNPTSQEYSLNYFLKKNNLQGKKDMPYLTMFSIYRDSTVLWDSKNNMVTTPELEDIKTKDEMLLWASQSGLDEKEVKFRNDMLNTLCPYIENIRSLVKERGDFTSIRDKREMTMKGMSEVAEYCVLDSFRCHQLFKIRTILMEKRSFAHRGRTSIYDSFYRAGSMKVRNLIITEGQKRGLQFTNITGRVEMGEKYSGGLVLPPNKDLVVPKLTIQERVMKAIIDREAKKTNNNIACEYDEWMIEFDLKNTSKTDAVSIDSHPLVIEIKEIISNHGAVISNEELRNIETKRGKAFPRCVRKFLTDNSGKPVTGLDFASLYPNIIMSYNISPEKMITNEKTAKEEHKKGVNLSPIKFEYSGRTRRAWVISHNSIIDNDKYHTDGGSMDEYPFGLYPTILHGLFKERASIRKPLNKLSPLRKKDINTITSSSEYSTLTWDEKKKIVGWEEMGWEEKKELMEKEHKKEYDETFDTEYDNISFHVNSINSTQKTLKVFMNIFYGECGNKVSPIYKLEAANGITMFAQNALRFVKKIVEEQKWVVKYGDTDSLYVYGPDNIFVDIDKKYYTGQIDKKQYCTELVNITFDKVKELRDLVNATLLEKHKTSFLQMAFEEVLFPAIYLAKKKYFGVSHVSIPNFSTNHLFIRGLDLIKRGVSPFMIKICRSVMEECMDINNLKSIIEIVCAKIDHIYDSNVKWDFDDFITTAVYKPDRNNVKLVTFVNRMKERNIDVIPGARFNYIIAEKYPYKYDRRGRKQELSVGDRMEYDWYARENNMKVDMDYYMEGSVNGQLARLIVYYEGFDVYKSDNTVDLKTREDKIYDNACKFIASQCAKYRKHYPNKGAVYQSMFRVSNAIVNNEMKKICGYGQAIDMFKFDWDMKGMESYLMEKAQKSAAKLMGKVDYGSNFVNAYIKYAKTMDKVCVNEDDVTERDQEKQYVRTHYIKKMYNAYVGKNGILAKRREMYEKRKFAMINKIKANAVDISNIYTIYSNVADRITSIIKKSIDIDDKYNSPYEQVPHSSQLLSHVDHGSLASEASTVINELASDDRFKRLIKVFNDVFSMLVNNEIYMAKTNAIYDHLRANISRGSITVNENDRMTALRHTIESVKNDERPSTIDN